MNNSYYVQVAKDIRKAFESDDIKKECLEKLYSRYNPIENIQAFLLHARKIFPVLNCGLTSVYLQNLLGTREIVNGYYKCHRHTFMIIDQDLIIDITADQYCGPSVYVGPFCKPWSRNQSD